MFFYKNAVPTGISSEEIDDFSEPIQIPIEETIIETSNHKGYNWTISALAEYELGGIVRGRKSYYFSWKAFFSPLDLCITWGELNSEYVEKHIKYRQMGRWYFFRYDATSPYGKAYIEQHASNNHIIPSNRNILKALRSARRGDKIELRGYLVNLFGRKGTSTYWWYSSLSRTDKGNGSCEVFYVDYVIVNGKIYQ